MLKYRLIFVSPSHHTLVQSTSYLLVDICPIVDQQLQTEGTVGGDGRQVQRGVAALVGLVDVSAVVDQLCGHSLLAHVAGHMERSVSKAVGLIDLRGSRKQDTKRSDWEESNLENK